MKTSFNIPLNAKSIGGALALVVLVVLYVLFADLGGVVGGALIGAAVGCVASGVVGLYRFLFA